MTHNHTNQPVDPAYLNGLIKEQEAADILDFTVRALQNWRSRGGGPPYVRISGRAVRYRRRDLFDWIKARLKRSTSEA